MLSKNQRRHGSPCPPRGPVVSLKPKVSPTPGPAPPLSFRVPRDFPHSRFNKAPLAVYPPKGARGKTCVSLPVVSLEKMPCLGRTEGGAHIRINCSSSTPMSSSPSSLKPPPTSTATVKGSGEKLLNGRGPPTPSSTTPSSTTPSSTTADSRPSPVRSPMDKRPFSSSPSPHDHRRPSPNSRTAAPSSPHDRKLHNGTRTPGPNKRLSGRVFDPNKHCGVQDPESKRPCTRSLTCKTHSLTHRRAVPGRRKHFDILLAEHKGRVKEGATDKGKDGGPKMESLGGGQGPPAHDTTPSTLSPHCHNSRTISTLKLRLASAHIPRVPGGGVGVLSSNPVSPATIPDPQASVWQRVGGDQQTSADREGHPSSDEDDPVTPDLDRGRAPCHYSPHHPRPLGFCAFNSRLMGRGHYVFDRRWDRMRLALHCMVEKHVNAQRWRKVPLVAEKLLHLGNRPASTPSSAINPPNLHSFPPSTNGAFSLMSYPAGLPQDVSVAGLYSNREPSQPSSSALGKHRSDAPAQPIRPPGAKRRKTSLLPSSDLHRRNGISHHSPPSPLCSGVSPLDAQRKTSGRSTSETGVGAIDWYSNPDSTPGTPYPITRDQSTPSTPTPNPLAYGGGVEGRRRRSPSAYGGGEKPSKMSIFRRSSPGLVASGPESPRQSKLHH
ncbi:hypothetical protein DPEC_G00108330 [Dallia pectoralis]|uniref:Uncharacterized protein n=1 Tax=Dallia pectoralis TaxID=75939 RepID=A0ACC2GSD4_DALPE|nr:hypothetical protein DPEC_G00108330 [Dallia pectoralis]